MDVSINQLNLKLKNQNLSLIEENKKLKKALEEKETENGALELENQSTKNATDQILTLDQIRTVVVEELDSRQQQIPGNAAVAALGDEHSKVNY